MNTNGNKVRHTPGPWRLFDSNGVIAVLKGPAHKHTGPKEVVKWTGFDGSDFQRQNRANARLIAAAPDMLALLQELWRDPRVVSHSQGPSEDWLLRARAVMREATGDF